jgi:hypothetical protein
MANLNKIKIIACVVKTFLEPLTYIYEDDESNLGFITEEILKDNQIPRIEGYVENIIPSLSAMQFKAHFRYVLLFDKQH